jgi:hypothetical protein
MTWKSTKVKIVAFKIDNDSGNNMPETKVVFYKEDDGTIPVLDWLNSLPPKVQDKCATQTFLLKRKV